MIEETPASMHFPDLDTQLARILEPLGVRRDMPLAQCQLHHVLDTLGVSMEAPPDTAIGEVGAQSGGTTIASFLHFHFLNVLCHPEHADAVKARVEHLLREANNAAIITQEPTLHERTCFIALTEDRIPSALLEELKRDERVYDCFRFTTVLDTGPDDDGDGNPVRG